MNHSKFTHFIGGVLFTGLLAAIGATIVMNLWNTILPPACGFSQVSFWQALGLLTLGLTFSGSIFILFIGLFHTLHHTHDSNRRRLRAKWESMTDEQRKEFFNSHGFNTDRHN